MGEVCERDILGTFSETVESVVGSSEAFVVVGNLQIYVDVHIANFLHLCKFFNSYGANRQQIER